MSNRFLAAVSVAPLCGAVAIAFRFDSKLALFLAILLATVGGVVPLGFITRRRGRTD